MTSLRRRAILWSGFIGLLCTIAPAAAAMADTVHPLPRLPLVSQRRGLSIAQEGEGDRSLTAHRPLPGQAAVENWLCLDYGVDGFKDTYWVCHTQSTRFDNGTVTTADDWCVLLASPFLASPSHFFPSARLQSNLLVATADSVSAACRFNFVRCVHSSNLRVRHLARHCLQV